DRVVFYFAGHGVAEERENGRDGPEGYLLLRDASQELSSFASMRLVYERLAALRCRHLLVILDCCFAGAFRWASTRDARRPYRLVHEERYNHYLRHPAK